MFFSGPADYRSTLETVIADVGLCPVYVGADEEATIDALFHLGIALALTQGRGRLAPAASRGLRRGQPSC